MIKQLQCSQNDSLIEVIKVINENAKGIAFIIDDNGKLCGTITDGDIRRALLNDIGLQKKIKSIVLKNYIYGHQNDDYDALKSKISEKVKIIPIVDNDHVVVDFFEYNQNLYLPVAIPSLNGNEFKYLTDAFMSSWISSSGEYIDKFEKGFSAYCGCQYGSAVTNGTSSLHLALLALDIGEGDEVIVPDLTFAATINAVLHAKATPVIVDVEKDSWCIDPEEIRKALTSQTKAIIPVHLYGQVCDMDAIMDIAQEFKLSVIEDCAEAHGAMFKDMKVGSIGDVGCFSFFGNKVITTGEGGMCITNDQKLDDKIRMLRDHGMSRTRRYWHDQIGFNYRMTNLQAAIGLAQLENISENHENRLTYENTYKDIFKDNHEIEFQKSDLKNRTKITWLVSILIDDKFDRDTYIENFKNRGIDVRAFFFPLSDMEIYKSYCKSQTQVTHELARKGMILPTYQSLTYLNEIKRLLKDV
jgi:perosamine synthetase